MKNQIIVFLLCVMPMCGIAQQDSLMRKGFNVGINYVHVKGSPWGRTDYALGVYGEYQFRLIKRYGITGIITGGIDKLQDCSLCESSWYPQAYWWGIGVERTFKINEQKFSVQARNRWFGFDYSQATSMDANGQLYDWRDGRIVTSAFGVKVGYRLPIKMPLELGFAHDYNPLHRLNSVSLAWQF